MNRSPFLLRLITVTSSVGLVALLVGYRAGVLRPSAPVLLNIAAVPSFVNGESSSTPNPASLQHDLIGLRGQSLIEMEGENQFALVSNPIVAHYVSMNAATSSQPLATNDLLDGPMGWWIEFCSKIDAADILRREFDRITFHTRSFNEPIAATMSTVAIDSSDVEQARRREVMNGTKSGVIEWPLLSALLSRPEFPPSIPNSGFNTIRWSTRQ